MDCLTFISELVKALAWPVFAFVLVLVIRKPLVALIPYLEHLKYKDFEVFFKSRVDEVKEETDRELPTETQIRPISDEQERILKLAEISPRAAVLDAWREVEIALSNYAGKISDLAVNRPIRTAEAIRIIIKNENTDKELIALLKDLQGLRNEAAHAPEFALSRESAIKYASAADAVKRRLMSISESK